MVVESKVFRLIETRCDRCQSLLSSMKIDEESNDVVSKGPSRNKSSAGGSFKVSYDDGVILEYQNLCNSCVSHMRTLISKMQPVNRVKGRGRKATKGKKK